MVPGDDGVPVTSRIDTHAPTGPHRTAPRADGAVIPFTRPPNAPMLHVTRDGEQGRRGSGGTVPAALRREGTTMTWDQALGQYATAQRAARRSAGTIRLHQHYLRHLAAQARRRGPWDLERRDLVGFVATYTRRSAETMKSARQAVVGFYRWAHGEGHVAVDPAVGLPPVSVPPGVAKPAPEAVLRRALERADARERLMLLLAAYAGLRCAEIARVHADEWDGRVLYVTGKGGKVRRVPVVHDELVAALDRAEGHVFPGRVDGHLSSGRVTELLSDVLEGQWTGHKLRHRFATRSHDANPDVLALGRVLGHSRPETTMRYVALSDDALLRVVHAAA